MTALVPIAEIAGTPVADAPPSGFASAGRLAEVPVAKLLIDPAYQRRTSDRSRAIGRRIADGFDWRRFGAIVVAEVADGLAVIDGQHRAIAAARRGISHVPAVIVAGDVAQQADAFVGINSARTSVPTVDKFRARVAAKEEDAVALAEMLAEIGVAYDLPPGRTPGPRETVAISRLQKLVRQHGIGLVQTTIETLVKAFPGEANVLTAFALEVTCVALDRHLEVEGNTFWLDMALPQIDFEDLGRDALATSRTIGGTRVEAAVQAVLREAKRNKRAA